MTQQNQYEPLPPAPHPSEQPADGYGQPGNTPQRTNTMAILGLVFAFLFSPLGVVFSAIGLKQVKERREGGRGLALTGLILSIVFILVGILVVVLALTVLAPAEEAGAQAEDRASVSRSEDPTGVVAACDVIAPAVMDLEGELSTVTTPEGYAQAMTALGDELEAAAAGTTDPTFIAHVQQLAADFQQAADTVLTGEDPTFLEEALATDGTAVDDDCAAAGWTE